MYRAQISVDNIDATSRYKFPSLTSFLKNIYCWFQRCFPNKEQSTSVNKKLFDHIQRSIQQTRIGLIKQIQRDRLYEEWQKVIITRRLPIPNRQAKRNLHRFFSSCFRGERCRLLNNIQLLIQSIAQLERSLPAFIYILVSELDVKWIKIFSLTAVPVDNITMVPLHTDLLNNN